VYENTKGDESSVRCMTIQCFIDTSPIAVTARSKPRAAPTPCPNMSA